MVRILIGYRIGRWARPLAASTLLAFATVGSPLAEEPNGLAEQVPSRVIAVVSGGKWDSATVETDDSEAPEEGAGETPAGSGYYRAVAIRSENRTSKLFLQKIRLTDGNPETLSTVEVEDLSNLDAFITDMRPENSTGVTEDSGFVVYVYLKEDPQVAEPDTWELFVDEFGDFEFLPASN